MVRLKLTQPKAGGSDESSEPHFCFCTTTMNVHEMEEQLDKVNQKTMSTFTGYQKEGSGWSLFEITL